MNSIERFDACMNHRQPDRVPIDIGAISLTGMRPLCRQRLSDLLGLTGEPEPANHGMDERILKWAGTDFRSVGSIADLPNSVKKRVSDSCAISCWGIQYEKVDGEWQISESPLRGATADDLKNFPWPEPRIDDTALEKWEDEAKRLQREGRYVIVGEHPVFGILELGCWMCGYDDFMLKLAMDPDFIRLFFDKVLAIQLKVIESYYGVLGPYIHLTTSGDDFGTQIGSFISPDMFADLIAPYFSARIARTKELGDCYYWHHSCGSIVKLLPQLIDCGVDILNPVQTSAAGMIPEKLKAEFGDSLVFWGAIDVQQLLPKASPDEIRREVGRLVEILGKDGGYVAAPAHEMQDDIPPENIVAMVEALKTGNRASF